MSAPPPPLGSWFLPLKPPRAVQICRNDFLSFGRMHFFFPDSRLNLDLTTDKTLREARFDRHFVRDMMWSRHQLEELAERRFAAAQNKDAAAASDPSKTDTTFTALFKEVRASAPAADSRVGAHTLGVAVSWTTQSYISCMNRFYRRGLWRGPRRARRRVHPISRSLFATTIPWHCTNVEWGYETARSLSRCILSLH